MQVACFVAGGGMDSGGGMGVFNGDIGVITEIQPDLGDAHRINFEGGGWWSTPGRCWRSWACLRHDRPTQGPGQRVPGGDSGRQQRRICC